MSKPLVSIVIPVYNVELYLSKCIDSILAQSFTDWECILVDDGSKDNSGSICDNYALKDNRIKVIHQNNRGVSIARQVGIDNVCGEYSIHIDPDDWVESNMIEELYNKAKSDDADMVICDYFKHEGGVQQYINQRPNLLEPIKIIEQMLTTNMYPQLYGSCCNKLVRCSCFNSSDNLIRFEPEDLSLGEDVVFNCRLLMSTVHRVSYLNKAFYHYEVRSNSLCSTLEKNIGYLIKIQEEIVKDKKILDTLSLKPQHLQILFDKKEFKEMKDLYPYTQQKIIQKYPHSFLSLALKGFPRFAYFVRSVYRLFLC